MDTSINQTANGKKEGVWVFWYENGQLEAEGSYVDGKKEGVMKRWYYEGQLSEEGFYLAGKKEGVWKQWYYEGQLSEEGFYVAGLKEGGLQKLNIPKGNSLAAVVDWVKTNTKKYTD